MSDQSISHFHQFGNEKRPAAGGHRRQDREAPQRGAVPSVSVDANPWRRKIRCVDIRHLDNAGPLRVVATITIGDALTIYGCRIIQQESKAAWEVDGD